MASRTPSPSGIHSSFPPDVMFFSTTDRKGVIETVNRSFVNLSHYEATELVGSPHNVVRHPDMPSGAFHIMWERLLAGKSMVAYVTNLAKDGSDYQTFSTVTPLGTGFISVRAAVTRPDLWEPVMKCYAQARALERGAREKGASRADAARQGAQLLNRLVGALGFASYEDVMLALLPAEVDERRRLAPPVPPPTQEGEALHDVVTALADVGAQLEVARLEFTEIDEIAASFERLIEGVNPAIAAMEEAALGAAEASSDAEDLKVLTTTSRAAITLAQQLRETLSALPADLRRVHRTIAEMRAALALSILHHDMAIIFAREFAEGQAIGDPVLSVQHLGQTLGVSAHDLAMLQSEAITGIGKAAALVADAQDKLVQFQRLLANWRNLVARFGAASTMGGGLSAVDARLNDGLREMNALRQLALRCGALKAPLDEARLTASARAVVDAAGRVAAHA